MKKQHLKIILYKGCGNKSVYLQLLAILQKYTNLLPHPLIISCCGCGCHFGPFCRFPLMSGTDESEKSEGNRVNILFYYNALGKTCNGFVGCRSSSSYFYALQNHWNSFREHCKCWLILCDPLLYKEIRIYTFYGHTKVSFTEFSSS